MFNLFRKIRRIQARLLHKSGRNPHNIETLANSLLNGKLYHNFRISPHNGWLDTAVCGERSAVDLHGATSRHGFLQYVKKYLNGNANLMPCIECLERYPIEREGTRESYYGYIDYVITQNRKSLQESKMGKTEMKLNKELVGYFYNRIKYD